MYRTYTMRLKVTRKQDEMLTRVLSQLCELYNMALQQRRDVWKSHRISIGRYDQQKQLTELRNGVEEYAKFPAAIQRDPLIRLDKAFRGFYRRVHNGEKPGFPRFRSNGQYQSFSVDAQNFRIEADRVVVIGFGSLRFKTHSKLCGIPKVLHIKRYGRKVQARMVCDVGLAPKKITVRNVIGIDLGLTSLVTLSDGTEIPNPRWTKQQEDCLAAANQDLARKVKGSKNRVKSRERLRRVHQRIAGKRRAYLHGISSKLVGRYDFVAYEALTINQMVHSRMAKSIFDAAWGELIYQLKVQG